MKSFDFLSTVWDRDICPEAYAILSSNQEITLRTFSDSALLIEGVLPALGRALPVLSGVAVVYTSNEEGSKLVAYLAKCGHYPDAKVKTSPDGIMICIYALI